MDSFTQFKDRREAGQLLATQLLSYQNDTHTIILALPRGGVPVASEIAKKLQLPLEIFIVRKLGAPLQEELAIGAIANGNTIFFNDDVINTLDLSPQAIKEVIKKEKKEYHRREKKYRQGRAFPNLARKNIILVDDGIATGATMRCAILALRKLSVQKIIIAVPVASESTLGELKPFVDEIVCVFPAPTLYGVGAFYDDFSQTTDEEVMAVMNETRKKN